MTKLVREFSSYSSVALVSAASDWIVFVVLFELLGSNVLVAQGIARVMGGVVSFATNRTWSFRSRNGHGLSRETIRFFVLYAASYAVSLSAIFVFSESLGFPAYVAKIAADSLCFLFNFLGMRLYVFSRRQGISDHAVSLMSWLNKSS
jgi:putative flippase GtrA